MKELGRTGIFEIIMYGKRKSAMMQVLFLSQE